MNHEAKMPTTAGSAGSAASDISSPPPEKVRTNDVPDVERFGEAQGYVLNEAVLRARLGLSADAQLKTDSSGRVLIPQPSDNPADPLNWSTWKKRSILVMLMTTAFTCDYSAATGASATLLQAEQWHISPSVVNHSTAGNTFMLGVGGIVVVWLSAYFGRLPVLFCFTIMAAATAIWSAAAQSFESYMASRILNGFFVVASAGGGLMWINDVFYFHERPRVINFWACAIILSPFLGPQIMAAIVSITSWRVGMYLNFGIIMLALLMVIVLGDETFYPRNRPAREVPDIASRPYWQRLIGIAQASTHLTGNTIASAGSRTVITATRLPVILICLFYFFDFGWTIGNNTTISVLVVPAYHLTFRSLAAIYVAPVVGAVIGVIIGYFVFDFIGAIWARRNDGIISPEARLIPIWLVLPFKIAGYNMIGTTIQQRLDIWILIIGWGMHNMATILTTSAVSAYLIDVYPEASGESAAWLNFSRTLAGFIVGYIHINWAVAQGTQLEYGIQTAIMGGAFVLFVIPLTVFGSKIRGAQKPLHFKTH